MNGVMRDGQPEAVAATDVVCEFGGREFKSRQPDDFSEGREALRSTARIRTLVSR